MCSAHRWSLLPLLLALLSCSPSSPAPAAAQPKPTVKPTPATVEDVRELRGQGVSWSNAEVRRTYLDLVGTIAAADARRKAAGESAESRARAAYKIRQSARLTSQAMMSDREQVAAQRARDQAKYGNPYGPPFDYLVAHERARGNTGDAVYEAIVASAQRTDAAVDEQLLGH